jgi:hypothetical protein
LRHNGGGSREIVAYRLMSKSFESMTTLFAFSICISTTVIA